MVRKGIQARDRLVPAAREFVIYGGNHALEGALGSFKAHKANLSSKPALVLHPKSLRIPDTNFNSILERRNLQRTSPPPSTYLALFNQKGFKHPHSIHGAEKEAAKMPATMQLLRTAGALHAANLYSRLLTQK